jgi:hypothetical protein
MVKGNVGGVSGFAKRLGRPTRTSRGEMAKAVADEPPRFHERSPALPLSRSLDPVRCLAVLLRGGLVPTETVSSRLMIVNDPAELAFVSTGRIAVKRACGDVAPRSRRSRCSVVPKNRCSVVELGRRRRSMPPARACGRSVIPQACLPVADVRQTGLSAFRWCRCAWLSAS